MRWRSKDKETALAAFARIEAVMPEGFREELTSHRRRIHHGRRRSCTIHIRHHDDRVPMIGPSEALRMFSFLEEGPEVIHKR